jgi:hypothetical protein
MLLVSAFMLGHHQAYKNVETWLMNYTHTQQDAFRYDTSILVIDSQGIKEHQNAVVSGYCYGSDNLLQ